MNESIHEMIDALHDCKRGLGVASSRDYLMWWRTMERLNAVYEAAEKILRVESLRKGGHQFPELERAIAAVQTQHNNLTDAEPPEIFEGTRDALADLTATTHEHEWIKGAVQYHCECGAIMSEAGSRERDSILKHPEREQIPAEGDK